MTTALEAIKNKKNQGMKVPERMPENEEEKYPKKITKGSVDVDATPKLAPEKRNLEKSGQPYTEETVAVGKGTGSGSGGGADGSGGGVGAGFQTEEPTLNTTTVARRAYNKDAPTQDDIELTPMPNHILETDRIERDEYLSSLNPEFVAKYKLNNPGYTYEEVKSYVEKKQREARQGNLSRAVEQATTQRLVEKGSQFADPTRKMNTNDVLEMYVLNSALQSASHAQSEQAHAANFERLKQGLDLLNKYKTDPVLVQEPDDVVQNQKLIFAATQMMAPLVGLAAGDAGAFMGAAATGGKQATDIIAKADKERKERNVAYAQAYNKAVGSSQKEVAGLIKEYMDTAEAIDKTRLTELSDIAAEEEKIRHNQKKEYIDMKKLRLDEAYKNKQISRNEWETKTKLWKEENRQITEWNKNQLGIAKLKSAEARAVYKLKGKIHTDRLSRANKKYNRTNRKTIDNVKYILPNSGRDLDRATDLEITDGRAYEVASNGTADERNLLMGFINTSELSDAGVADPKNAQLAKKTINFLRIYSDMVRTNKKGLRSLVGQVHPGNFAIDMDNLIRNANLTAMQDKKEAPFYKIWKSPEYLEVPNSEELEDQNKSVQKYYQILMSGFDKDSFEVRDLSEDEQTVLQESIIRTVSKLEERLNRAGLKSATINYQATKAYEVGEYQMSHAYNSGYGIENADEAAKFLGVPDAQVFTFIQRYEEWLKKTGRAGED